MCDCKPISAPSVRSSVLCAWKGQEAVSEWAFGQRPSIIARSLLSACVPSCPPSFPLAPTSVFVRCMKPFTLFFSPCQFSALENGKAQLDECHSRTCSLCSAPRPSSARRYNKIYRVLRNVSSYPTQTGSFLSTKPRGSRRNPVFLKVDFVCFLLAW